MSNILLVTSECGKQLRLEPFPMDHMPSQCESDFVRFLSEDYVAIRLFSNEITKVQHFMRQHQTEALSDNSNPAMCFYTIAGNGLRSCNPFYRDDEKRN